VFVSDNCYQVSKSITDITNATNTGVGLQAYCAPAARSRRVVICSANFLPIKKPPRQLKLDASQPSHYKLQLFIRSVTNRPESISRVT
jgi:hypothetical protein